MKLVDTKVAKLRHLQRWKRIVPHLNELDGSKPITTKDLDDLLRVCLKEEKKSPKKKKSPKLKKTTIANQQVDEDDDSVFNEEDIDSYSEESILIAENTVNFSNIGFL